MNESTHLPSLRLLPRPERLLEKPALPGSQAARCHQEFLITVSTWSAMQLSCYTVSLSAAPFTPHITHNSTLCRRPSPPAREKMRVLQRGASTLLPPNLSPSLLSVQ